MPQSSTPNKTYVYNGTEVTKTGRVARRQLRGSARNRTSVDVLYEIKPFHHTNGTWTDWVRDSDLYEIIEHKENNDE